MIWPFKKPRPQPPLPPARSLDELGHMAGWENLRFQSDTAKILAQSGALPLPQTVTVTRAGVKRMRAYAAAHPQE